MANKSNIRSIRFSDDLAELIERQTGSNFSEKFTNLITRCVWELPQKERQLKSVVDQINLKQEELRKLQKRYSDAAGKLSRLSMRITQLGQDLDL